MKSINAINEEHFKDKENDSFLFPDFKGKAMPTVACANFILFYQTAV